MAFTLAQLLAPQTEAELTAAAVSDLNSRGQPTDQWLPASMGGVELTNVGMLGGTLAAYAAQRSVDVAEMRHLKYAAGEKLAYRALHFYELAKRLAQPTIQTIQVTVEPGGPSYSYPAGEMWFESDAGHIYRSIDDLVLNSSEKDFVHANIRAQAEEVGSAANDDNAGSIHVMVTPLPAVSCTNVPLTDWSAAVLNGYSSGTITPSFATAGVPPPSYSTLKVKIDASGDPEGGSFSWSTDGGQSWTSGGVMHSGVMIDGYTRISFVNSSTVHPGFIALDVFSFQVADSIVQRGTDDETDAALRKRCANRWASLAAIPVRDSVDLLAHEASAEVDRVLTSADLTIAGMMHVRIASTTGAASVAAVAAVQDFIQTRLTADGGINGTTQMPFERVTVSPVDVRQLTVTTTITVARDKLATIQAAAQANWVAYLKNVPIGGQVLFSKLQQAIMDAGAIDTDEAGTQINGQPYYSNLVQMGPVEIPVAAGRGLLDDTVTWVPA